ncbi:MAG: N-acetylneuraminate synthase [Candidatus Marinimicrobia bacterium]|mgnify:CR=1 FL=1|nr:N-acetylneuraminate synthase [Candidatus Neomarinimicrobiota bacterium]|tara:strand:- start:138 stop:1190 length:1053 start_codon:yes stop_codon:yes gene_type:complete
MSFIKIGNNTIGRGLKPYIIAEAGINHNGELEKALKMIEVAKTSGADAIKFQTFKAKEVITDPSLTFTYKSQGKKVTESMIDLFSRYEFKNNDWNIIYNKCVEVGITFLSTPQNFSDLEILMELNMQAIKVGSDDFTNLYLLKRYAKTNIPLILSCGMADLAEIHTSLETVGAFENYPVILLLCISQYPTPIEDVNLKRLHTLQESFPMIPIGFSDHTIGPLASALATGLGACILEKHFTLDKKLPGPDHWFSENPDGLNEWVISIHDAYKLLGSPIVRPTKLEKEMKDLARRSVVAIEDIQKKDNFTTANIGLRRPGTGLNSSIYETILKKKATRKIKKGDLIQFGDFV